VRDYDPEAAAAAIVPPNWPINRFGTLSKQACGAKRLLKA
jgi:hypothetical protein